MRTTVPCRLQLLNKIKTVPSEWSMASTRAEGAADEATQGPTTAPLHSDLQRKDNTSHYSHVLPRATSRFPVVLATSQGRTLTPVVLCDHCFKSGGKHLGGKFAY